MNGTWRNTGLPAPTVEEIFSGNHVLVEYQAEDEEPRWVAVGTTRAGRILTIVFTVRSVAIRPITGWVADKQTAELFIKEWGQR